MARYDTVIVKCAVSIILSTIQILLINYKHHFKVLGFSILIKSEIINHFFRVSYQIIELLRLLKSVKWSGRSAARQIILCISFRSGMYRIVGIIPIAGILKLLPQQCCYSNCLFISFIILSHASNSSDTSSASAGGALIFFLVSMRLVGEPLPSRLRDGRGLAGEVEDPWRFGLLFSLLGEVELAD